MRKRTPHRVAATVRRPDLQTHVEDDRSERAPDRPGEPFPCAQAFFVTSFRSDVRVRIERFDCICDCRGECAGHPAELSAEVLLEGIPGLYIDTFERPGEHGAEKRWWALRVPDCGEPGATLEYFAKLPERLTEAARLVRLGVRIARSRGWFTPPGPHVGPLSARRPPERARAKREG